MNTLRERIVFPLVVFVCVIGLGFATRKGARADESNKPDVIQIHLRDFCDPPTFNQAVGAGTCIGSGLMLFDTFIAELGEEKSVGEWRFNPDEIRAKEETKLVLVNRGGELHTFTRVEEFGGGFVTLLNALSGNPVLAPECARVLPDGSLVPQPPGPGNLFLLAKPSRVRRLGMTKNKSFSAASIPGCAWLSNMRRGSTRSIKNITDKARVDHFPPPLRAGCPLTPLRVNFARNLSAQTIQAKERFLVAFGSIWVIPTAQGSEQRAVT
ncbi:MAG: hypothetical protein DMG44_17315 [Acidobacteria bacterium]|nr:MAG: hypothetical protein DMG44_17315 [Acidobacteriota bacterium]